jgi:hypothetical protein
MPSSDELLRAQLEHQYTLYADMMSKASYRNSLGNVISTTTIVDRIFNALTVLGRPADTIDLRTYGPGLAQITRRVLDEILEELHGIGAVGRTWMIPAKCTSPRWVYRLPEQADAVQQERGFP